ncbi:MAG: hypothetical protein OEW18_00900 [Candidatus Aminicenantes bacterium]|nr:hypothetical protein [Candidatus Aminicenantes bacterium]
MSRNRFFIAAMMLALFAGAVAYAGQTRMRSGEATIFFRSGDSIIDKILDISSERLVLETENNGEFPLRDIWMINFVDDGWDFPAERDRVETRDQYVFLRNDAISAGRIVDFSSERRVFQFESGEEFPIGQVRRLYFAKDVPASLAAKVQAPAQQVVSTNPWVGTFGRGGPAAVEIILRENHTAQMTLDRAGARELTFNGRWEQINAGSIRVVVTSQVNARDLRTMAFGLEGDTLISLSGSLGKNARLQRR